MSTQFFVRHDGNTYGPFDSQRLRKLAAAKKICPTSEIGKSADGPWFVAATVRGLYPSVSSSDGPPTTTTLALADESHRSSTRTCASTRKPLPKIDWPERPSEPSMWYYRLVGDNDEDAKGPVDDIHVDKLIADGKIRPSTFVLREGTAVWETAFSAGLFLGSPRDARGEGATLANDGSSLRGSAQEASALAATGPEEILWSGKPSHHANYFTYALCAAGAVFYYPAKWGLRKFGERDRTRYEITTERVRIREGDEDRQRTIPLSRIRSAQLSSPAFLRDTNYCDIALYGESHLKPLATLEGIRLDQCALVISLCESALSQQLPVEATPRILARQAVQNEIVMRRLERAHERAMRAAEGKMFSAGKRSAELEYRARQAEQKAVRLQAVLGDCPEEVVARSMQAFTSGPIPRPPKTQHTSGGSGLFGWLIGRSPEENSIWVRGAWRNGKWIRPHRRRVNRD